MNCNCITAVEENIQQKLKQSNEVSPRAELDQDRFFVGDQEFKGTYSTVTVECAGRTSPYQYKVFHSYCPFCGKPARKRE